MYLFVIVTSICVKYKTELSEINLLVYLNEEFIGLQISSQVGYFTDCV